MKMIPGQILLELGPVYEGRVQTTEVGGHLAPISICFVGNSVLPAYFPDRPKASVVKIFKSSDVLGF